ncbi:hypothetical protein [Glaesserella sp.]|uniref:hypothetical protein n=1 Tax=Glaesserella sp. TaxID=2094731 RepID=UPI0035A0F78E
MKKFTVVAAAALLSACQFSGFGKVTSNNFVGNWECRMDGGNISTTNQINLDKDGKAKYLGRIMLPRENPLFQYDVQRTGTWAYAENILTYQFSKSTVTPKHSDEIQKALKTDKELKTMEKEYYQAINSQMTKPEQKSVNLTVSNVTSDSFAVEQKLNQTIRTGICTRPVKK